MKIKMRAAAIAAAAAVTAGFGTLSAFAETADVYNIWVGGVQVTGENLEDVLDDGGSVSYDPEEGVLYLNDPKIEGDHNGAKIYAEGAPLTVYGQVYLTAEESGKTVIWSEQDLIFENALFTADGFYDGYVSENGSLSFNNSEACFEANGTYPAHGGLLSGGDISVKKENDLAQQRITALAILSRAKKRQFRLRPLAYISYYQHFHFRLHTPKVRNITSQGGLYRLDSVLTIFQGSLSMDSEMA